MADALALAEIAHCMQGRTRLRIAVRRGDTAFFDALAAGLAAHPGITAVTVTALTGSVLVRHCADFEEIAAVAEKAGLFRLAGAASPQIPPAPVEAPRLGIDPKLAIAALLGAIALWQLGHGKVLPPALTLLWYATRLAGLGASPGSLDESA